MTSPVSVTPSPPPAPGLEGHVDKPGPSGSGFTRGQWIQVRDDQGNAREGYKNVANFDTCNCTNNEFLPNKS